MFNITDSQSDHKTPETRERPGVGECIDTTWMYRYHRNGSGLLSSVEVFLEGLRPEDAK